MEGHCHHHLDGGLQLPCAHVCRMIDHQVKQLGLIFVNAGRKAVAVIRLNKYQLSFQKEDKKVDTCTHDLVVAAL